MRKLLLGITLSWLAWTTPAANRPTAATPPPLGYIPTQTFMMGDETGTGRLDERPVHPVTLSAYYLSPYLVTVQEYCQFLNESPWVTEEGDYILRRGGKEVLVDLPASPIAKEGRKYVPQAGKARHPMYYLSWEGAALYCDYRSEKEGLRRCYHPDSQWAADFAAGGYHLPTEAQWECAARAGNAHRLYPWGDTLTPKQANYDNNVGHFTEVGSYPPNDYGIYDMAGNITEWCHDLYKTDYYSKCASGVRDPVGPASVSLARSKDLQFHALRGGFYYQPAEFHRCARRFGTSDDPTELFYDGFRVARQAPPSPDDEARRSAPVRSEGSPSEMKVASDWVEEIFMRAGGGPADVEKLPFSFVLDGQPSRTLLKSWKISMADQPPEPGKKHRTILAHDPKTGLEVACEVTTFENYPAVDWVLKITNRGTSDTALLEDVHVLDRAFTRQPAPGREFMLRHSRGSRASIWDFAPTDEILGPDQRRVFGGHGGRSSDYTLPFMNLAWDDGGAVMAIGWSGEWKTVFERDHDRSLRVQVGLERMHLKLHPGESIRTPRMLLLFWQGESLLRGHNLFRQLILAHYNPRVNGQLVIPPIAGGVGDLNEYSEQNQLAAARQLSERGVEVQWIDAGWFVGGWPNGMGTWAPKPDKFPRGLGPVGDAVHAAGMKFLVWFELERVSEGSRIAREHPEWVIGPITRYGGLLNWGIPEAQKWITDLISDLIEQSHIDIFRADYNMESLDYWQRNDPPDRQGMTEIQFVEGMYRIWDELRARHPGLWIDNCASGGRLIDLETTSRAIPLWESDLQIYGPTPTGSQLQNGGLNLYLPMHAGGGAGVEPSYEFRSSMSAGNVIADIQNKPIDQARQTAAMYQRIRPYFEGDYYPLFEHTADEMTWYGYQLHRPDQQRGMAVVFRRGQSPHSAAPIMLEGIDLGATYKLTDKDSGKTETLKGDALRALVVKIDQAPGSRILFYEKQ